MLNKPLIIRKFISWEPEKLRTRFFQNIKVLVMTFNCRAQLDLIWPLLPVETGSSKFQKFISQELLIILSKFEWQFEDRLACSNFCTDIIPVWHCLLAVKDDVIDCVIILNQRLIFKKSISEEPYMLHTRSLHHMKAFWLLYKSYTVCDPIWPWLPVETGS